MTEREDIARKVLLHALQSHGQSEDKRVQAWQAAIDFMGLSVTLAVGERDGRKGYTFDGPDAEQALAFMDEVTKNFPLGQFEAEQSMIEGCLQKYARRA